MSAARTYSDHARRQPAAPRRVKRMLSSARGEAVDERATEAAGREAMQASVGKQIEAGLDAINDGEQSSESFVLYMRHRLLTSAEKTRAC